MKLTRKLAEQVSSELEAIDVIRLISSFTRLNDVSAVESVGRCPICRKDPPSFHARRHPAYFYCFSCGSKGDVVDFVRQVYKVSCSEAIKILADREKVFKPKKRLEASV